MARLLCSGIRPGHGLAGPPWERLPFESDDAVLAGAINPVTGSLWLVLMEEETRASLTEATGDWAGPGAERQDLPVLAKSLGHSWSPDGVRAIITDAYRNTGLVVLDPR